MKLDRSLKKRFEQDLKDGLSVPTQAGAVFLTRILAGLHAGGVKYLGQKGHAQKVLSYIHKARNLDFPEAQLEELCQQPARPGSLSQGAALRRYGRVAVS